MAKTTKKEKPLKIGVLGVRRGETFARGAGDLVGMKLVAICDVWKERLEQAGKRYDVTTYEDFDKFLEHDMDAVVLANYFHEHAPFAVKALKAGKHVMSETSACLTLAQGVELIDAVEKSGKVYMFAENYPFMLHNQEMRRLFQMGKLGSFMYGEGEYVHPMDADSINKLSPGVNHWRNWIPSTYYCTHALAPLMYITDTMPTKVNGFVIPHAEDNPVAQRVMRQNDAASMIAVRMDNGATVKLLQVGLRGHHYGVRIHGSKGMAENLRFGDSRMVRLVREQYHEKQVDPVEQVYLPNFPEHQKLAMKAGHGGGDFFMSFHFARAIRTNTAPYFDVYRGVAASIVGPLAYRSALDDSNTVVIPNLRDKKSRKQYAGDHWSPDPTQRKKGDPSPSINGTFTPTKRQEKYARKNWKEIGYKGD